ncbi:MAG: transposase [Deltaproteobacteria bacterium]|nr:transposase [Deltaproteobacteria bacterium]
MERFKADFKEHHGDPSLIQEICCDMSAAFIKGVEKHLPE